MEKSCGAVLYKMIEGTPYYVLVFASVYGFPKGHVERGETEEETAAREVWEETGVRAEIFTGFRREVVYPSPIRGRGKKTVVFFLAECPEKVLPRASHEIRSIVLKSYEEAMTLLKHPALRNVLTEANEFILSKHDKGGVT